MAWTKVATAARPAVINAGVYSSIYTNRRSRLDSNLGIIMVIVKEKIALFAIVGNVSTGISS